MAKEELFRIPVLGWAIEFIGSFPVKRGKADRNALKITYQKLQDGQVIGMFPEGTRQAQGEQGKAKRGVAQIVQRTQVPVLPVKIDLNRWKRPLKVFVGKPINFEVQEKKPTKEELNEMAEKMMQAIRELG